MKLLKIEKDCIESMAEDMYAFYIDSLFHNGAFCQDCLVELVMALSLGINKLVETNVHDPIFKRFILDSFPHVEKYSLH